MIHSFLKAKHWQLFLLTFGVPFIFQIIMMVFMFTTMASTNSGSDPKAIFDIMMFSPLISVLFMGVLFGWFWSVAIGLQKKIPSDIKMPLTRFKIFFFVPLVYLIIISLVMAFSFKGMMNGTSQPNPALIAGAMVFIVPLHLFSMFCIFHSLYFAAKVIKTAELQRNTSFSDFAGEFFLIWFFPIGIWMIQPKVNSIYEEEIGFSDDEAILNEGII